MVSKSRSSTRTGKQSTLTCWSVSPPGYVEPRHNHASNHSVIVLEGLQIAEGEPLQPGDYLWADGSRPHGPFEYPEGCVVFASFRGPSSQHRYQGSPAGDI